MSQTATVTGATGYIAVELVKQLLAKGYNVRGTVRSTKDKSKVSSLDALAKALPGTLELFEADLLQEGSFDEAVKGADVVFHTASPFFIEWKEDPHKELIEPAVHGTKNLLSSVVKHKDSVKRVIVTSSVAAIVGNGDDVPPPKNGKTYNEDDWNTSSTPEGGAYFVSKVQAEKAAWELAKAEGLDLVVIAPNFVMGPVTSSHTSGTSIGFFKAWLEGHPGGSPVYTDVRDVARAHILAAEEPTASGRYIVSHTHYSNPRQISEWLQERFPQYEIPTGDEKPENEAIDNSKILGLGLAITPLKETFIDMAVTLIQLGLAQPKSKA